MGKYIVTIIIIMSRKGKYMVREDIEKAPTHDHPCNLTRCVYIHELVFFIFINFPSIFTNATITIKCYNFLSGFVYFFPWSIESQMIVKTQCSISRQEQKENFPYLEHYF